VTKMGKRLNSKPKPCRGNALTRPFAKGSLFTQYATQQQIRLGEIPASNEKKRQPSRLQPIVFLSHTKSPTKDQPRELSLNQTHTQPLNQTHPQPFTESAVPSALKPQLLSHSQSGSGSQLLSHSQSGSGPQPLSHPQSDSGSPSALQPQLLSHSQSLPRQQTLRGLLTPYS
jgi:hypothetical protein